MEKFKVFDHMIEGVQVIGHDFRYLYVNEVAAKYGKSSINELVGYTVMEKYPGIENTEIFKSIQKCLSNKVHHRLIDEFDFPDGSKGYFDLRFQPLEEGVLIMSIDITDQKRDELFIKERNEKLEKELSFTKDLLEQAGKASLIGFWILDIASNDLQWSDTTKLIHEVTNDYKPELESSINFYEENDSRKKINEVVNTAIEQHIPFDVELHIITAKNNKKWVKAIGIPEVKNGKCIRLYGTFQDIHSIKVKEEEITSQNDILKKLNGELDNFVYRVSHDLRAPIASSLGITELCLMTNQEPELEDLLSRQFHNLTRLDNFIQDILNYSRNSRLQIQKETIDFNSFINEITSRHVPSNNVIELRIIVEELVPLVSDKTRLKIIFNNLVSNAFKFYASFKSNPFIEIKAKITLEKAVFKVSDNGIGIKKQYLNNIFEMFFRATDSNYGSGLGLYITKEAINKMGGEIYVESEYGQGTSFTVTIPNSA